MATLKKRDMPAIPADPAKMKAALDAMREALQVFLGYRGDPLDRAITPRDAISLGILDVDGRYSGGGGSGGTPGPAGPPGPPGGTVDPDLTPPPTPTGLAVTAGMSYLYVTWDVPAYTQGQGNGQTNVYGVPWPDGDPTPPTFSEAIPLGAAAAFTTLYAHPSTTGTRWCIWIKWQSVDGVESTSPAGGTNGVQATTGKVGTSDLGSAIVLAGNLAPGSVTADKAALEIGGENLLANNSFEVDLNANGIGDGWVVYGSTQTPVATRTAGRISGNAQRVSWTGTNTTTKGFAADTTINGGVRGGWRPNTTYVVSFYARTANTYAVGCELGWSTAPATTVTLKNPALTSTWKRYAFRITWGAGVDANGVLRLTCEAGQPLTDWIEFDDVQVEEGDTLSGYFGKLAVNTIVAGDAAIANGAITNALIANAAIDDAKIANLSAAKLTAGDGTIGNILKSANYSAGVAGWLLQANGSAEFGFAAIRGTLQAAQVSAGFITANMISANSISATKLVTGSAVVTGTAQIADAIITAAKIVDATITTAKIADATITAAKIADATITAAKIANATITTAKIADAQITNAKIGNAAVDTLQLAGQAVTIPASAYVESLSRTAGTVTCATMTFASSGAPITLFFACQVDNADPFNGTAADFALERVVGVTVTELLRWTPTILAGADMFMAFPPIVDTPGAVTVTYRVRKLSSGTSIGVQNRGLFVIEVKR